MYIKSIDKFLQRHEFIHEMGRTGSLQQKIDYYESISGNGDAEFSSIDQLKKDFKLYLRQFKVSTFVPPTVEEVAAYFNYLAQKDWGLVAIKFGEVFTDYYVSRSWHYGKSRQKMVDWKSCVRNTWDIHAFIKKWRHLNSVLVSIEQRKKDFYTKLAQHKMEHDYPPEFYRSFYNKWAQPDSEGRLLRFEHEEFWDLNLRIENHYHNEYIPSLNRPVFGSSRVQQGVSEDALRKALGIRDE